MATAQYTSSNKTIYIESTSNSITIQVSGFDGKTNYNREFYMYCGGSLCDGDGYFALAANVAPPAIWEGYRTDLASNTSYRVSITVYNSDKTEEVWHWENDDAISTEPGGLILPYIRSLSIDGTSGSIRYRNDNDFSVTAKVYFDGTRIANASLSSGSSRTTSFDFDDFDQTCYLRVVFSKSGYEDAEWASYVTSDSAPLLTAPSYSNIAVNGKNISFSLYNENSVSVTYTITGGKNTISGTLSKNATTSITVEGTAFNTNHTIKITFSNDDYKSSSASFSVKTGSKTKPSLFSWTYAKESGGYFNLTREEWNSFMSTVEAEIAYVGHEPWGWTKASDSNPNFTDGMCNEAYNLLHEQLYMGGYGTLYTVTSGQQIEAYLLNQFVKELNQAINVYNENEFG